MTLACRGQHTPHASSDGGSPFLNDFFDAALGRWLDVPVGLNDRFFNVRDVLDLSPCEAARYEIEGPLDRSQSPG
jgi:hypothetical protein